MNHTQPSVREMKKGTTLRPRDSAKQRKRPSRSNASTSLVMKFSITLLLLLACLYVIILSKCTPNEKHWAYGLVGSLVGHWFRS
jgi:hypothetical protein